ncbi:SUMF1/EgtB/PvdO family nonheme iron enzyme [Halosquirtibacter laminarini]|uniref:SUMF1/EgtB/PvdO family nonheme iron enzyme n=1 Tax=Halosquirtibacter laminarini TaxID=3374600 RepID=A0AC61NN28_9BACT|nr:SUMF1/EgtB/PvdO family nonheme iron enzyme [Prolixibacteraceae bacterium]
MNLKTLAVAISCMWSAQHVTANNNSDWGHDVVSKRSAYQKQLEKHPNLFTSSVIRKGMSENVSVDVRGLNKLVLSTWNTKDGNRDDDFLWIDPILITTKGDTVRVTEEMFEDSFGWSTSWTKWRKSKAFVFKKQPVVHGLFSNGNTIVRVPLNRKYKRFEAKVALSDIVNKKSSVQFTVGSCDAMNAIEELQKNYPIYMEAVQKNKIGVSYWFGHNDIDILTPSVTSLVKTLNDPTYFNLKVEEASELGDVEKINKLLFLIPDVVAANRAQSNLVWIKPSSIKMAIEDMYADNTQELAKAKEKLSFIQNNLDKAKKGIYQNDANSLALASKIVEMQKSILLNNDLLKDEKLLTVQYHYNPVTARRMSARDMGMPVNNWSVHTSKRKRGYDCELVELSDFTGKLESKEIYKPKEDFPITDIQLHWNADRLMFTSVSEKSEKLEHERWDLFELETKGNKVKRITDIDEADVDFFDGTYLPSGKVIMSSTLGYNGVPCVNGSDKVGNLTLFDPKTKALRRLNFGQDNDWDPVIMNNGKVQYLRWEYTDNTHYFSRIMMHMNPDGTNKKELYGSGSFWPNSMFDAQPLPGVNTNKFVAIVSGHHGVARSGRLVIFDPTKGRQEEKGVVQEIPYKDRKVVPEIMDRLVDGVYPQFVKPYPLNEKYFIVSAKMDKDALWGLYLVDIYDNMTPIALKEGVGFCDVVPFKKRETPPVIPEKVKLDKKDATVYIQDIYEGQGLKGVPRGSVKELRIFAYEYAFVKSPSNHAAQGIQSGWDMKRLLGTVPVEKDGSVMFTVPANIPISMQPLDEDGAAIQWMRSWMTAMPGEVVSCVGCHEDQNTIARPKFTIASRKKPVAITAPEGGIRSFTFKLEMQPLLDRKCIGCHDGSNDLPNFKDHSIDKKIGYGKSYLAIHPYVRRQGPEADIHVMKPMEYHANTSDLVQMLKKGHHGVALEEKEWHTLYNWIDFNAPYHGTFQSNDINGVDQVCRRQELMKKYNNVSVDWKKEIEDYTKYLDEQGPVKTVTPKKVEKRPLKEPRVRKWPFGKSRAVDMVADYKRKTLVVDSGMEITLVYVPKGTYVAIDEDLNSHQEVARKVKIKKGFWMSESEISNEEYRAIFPKHDSRFIAQQWKDHTTAGYPANKPLQPVIRVSWDEANAYCEALSKKNGVKVVLPTEEQWEWAARCGTDHGFWFGSINADFSKYENFADDMLADMAVVGVNPQPMHKNHWLRKYFDFIPRVHGINDKQMLTAPVKSYQPNAWGLYDMLGNVAEWTRSSYVDKIELTGQPREYKVVKGGSWRDRPELSTPEVRNYYYPWQKVTKVGFRIIVED